MKSANQYRMRRLASCLLACAAVTGLSACGGTTTVVTESHSSAPTGSTQTGAASTSSTPSGTSSTGASSTTATATTSTGAASATPTAGVPACVASMLKLGYLGGEGATGHGELGFSLTNVSAGACHTYGYPGVQFLSSAGAALPTNSTRTTDDFFGHLTLATLTIDPGSEASFRLVTTHGEASDAGCTTAAQLQVIPPDDTHTLVATIPNGTYECGTVTVSPVEQGTTAFTGG